VSQDNYLYSVNYSHHGDVKQWYGVPAGIFIPSSCQSVKLDWSLLSGHAKRLEKACSTMLPLLFEDTPDQMQHMTLQISPSQLICTIFTLLLSVTSLPHSTWSQSVSTQARAWILDCHLPNGIPWRLQLRGECPLFLNHLLSPQGLQFNIGEAVNFAIPDWLKYGGQSFAATPPWWLTVQLQARPEQTIGDTQDLQS
jgi:hypothetical protein